MSTLSASDGGLRLRHRRRAGIIDEMKKGGNRSEKKKKGSNSMDPIDDIAVNYQCQYNVTNTGSCNVTALVVSTASIDGGTIEANGSMTYFLDYLEPNGSATFRLDYDVTTGACPSVTVTAASNKDCGETSVSWSPPTPIK